MWDLENLDYKSLKWDDDSQRARFAYFEKQGKSLRQIAKHFYFRPMSATFIHLRFRTLFGRGYEGPKYRTKESSSIKRKCVVCGEDFETKPWTTTKMHPECRHKYFKDQAKKNLAKEREQAAKEIWGAQIKQIRVNVGGKDVS